MHRGDVYSHFNTAMRNKKLFSFFALATLACSTIAAAESESACKIEAPKKITIARPKPAEPLVQEITLNCGSQSTTQIIPSATAASGPQHQSSAFSWDKLLDAIAKLLGSIAWPIAAAFIAFFFKRELAALLARLKKGKWGSAEFEFENYVREVDAEADIPRTPEAENITPSAAARASVDPRGAIVSAWIEVEDALFDLVRVRQLSEPVSSAKARSSVWAIRAAQKAQALDATWVALFQDLRAMRNEAAHSTDFSPPPEAVIKYVQLAKELTNAIRVASA